jgi:hypothetical protein
VALDTIQDEIKNILEGVSGIGMVHDYERWADTWEKLLELFRDSNKKINGWTFTRRTTKRQRTTLGETEKAHIFVLQGIYSLNDADGSEKVFQNIIENVVEAFDENQTLNDTCLSINPDWGPMDGAVGVQVDLVENRMFGKTKILCHFADCRLCALETIAD